MLKHLPSFSSKKKKQEEGNSSYAGFSSVEIFGSTFAILLVVFLLIFLKTGLSTTLEVINTEKGNYQIEWVEQNSAKGFVVLSLPDKLHILETNEKITKDEICKNDSPFIQYSQKIYGNASIKNNLNQMIFAIVTSGVDTMAIARDCLRLTYPNKFLTIGWIIANKDLLEGIKIDKIPYNIK